MLTEGVADSERLAVGPVGRVELGPPAGVVADLPLHGGGHRRDGEDDGQEEQSLPVSRHCLFPGERAELPISLAAAAAAAAAWQGQGLSRLFIQQRPRRRTSLDYR